MSTVVVPCPHCGEPTDVFVDPGGAAQQRFIDDCVVCCRPIEFVAVRDEEHGEFDVAASSS